MDLVPSVINSKFGHLGGVSEAGKAEKNYNRGWNQWRQLNMKRLEN